MYWRGEEEAFFVVGVVVLFFGCFFWGGVGGGGGGQILITVLILKARPAETTSMTGVCMCVLHHLFEDHAFVCALCCFNVEGKARIAEIIVHNRCICSPEYRDCQMVHIQSGILHQRMYFVFLLL